MKKPGERLVSIHRIWTTTLRHGWRLRLAVAVGAIVLQRLACAAGSAVIINTDLAVLSSAIQTGGLVRLAFDGTITLNESFAIAKDTTLDASGHIVKLDGDNLVRHFVVTNGATLRLVNLTLVNGYFRGRDGQTNAPSGGIGQGGSILNAGGTLELVSCRFLNNQVHAGDAANLVDNPEPHGGQAFGGAICSVDGAVVATNCVFSGNHGVGGNASVDPSGATGKGGDSFGGAMYLTNSRINLEAVVFTKNVVQGGESPRFRISAGGGSALGGALAVELGSGVLSNSIARCQFDENSAYGATRSTGDPTRAHADGGALFCGSGSLSIEETLFRHNLALGGPGWDHTAHPTFGDGKGGAIYIGGGEVVIRNTALVFNQATGGSLPPGCCSFASAWAGNGSGGAIYNSGILELINSTVAENRANGGTSILGDLLGNGGSAFGGGILNEGSATLVNATIAENATIPGVGPALYGPPKAQGDALTVLSGTITLTNTILSSVEGRTNVWGTIQDGGHNISSDVSANFSSPSSKNNADPLLGPLGNNGGLTPTMALLFGSPAINAADATVCPPTDQRGVARPVGSGCDIGAFEYSAKLTLVHTAGAAVTIRYEFEAGQTNSISASDNLLDWELLGTGVTDNSGSFEVEDPQPAGTPMRFYRAEPPMD